MYSKQISPPDGETVRMQQQAERRVKEFYRRQTEAVHRHEPEAVSKALPQPSPAKPKALASKANLKDLFSKGTDTWLLLALLLVLLEEDSDPLLLLAIAYVLL